MKRKQKDIQISVWISIPADFIWDLDTQREGDNSQIQMLIQPVVSTLTSAVIRLMQRQTFTETKLKMIYTFYVHMQVMWYVANKENIFGWTMKSP